MWDSHHTLKNEVWHGMEQLRERLKKQHICEEIFNRVTDQVDIILDAKWHYT